MSIIQYKNEPFHIQKPENDNGYREYKKHFILVNQGRKPRTSKQLINKRATQMLYRLYEGNGKAKYYIGINDDGSIYGMDGNELTISIKHFTEVCHSIDITIEKITIYLFEDLFNNIKYVFLAKITKKISDSVI